MIGRKEFEIIIHGKNNEKQELFNQLRRDYRTKYDDLRSSLEIDGNLQFANSTNKGDLLELWTCACFGGILYKDIDSTIKIELGLSTIDKGIDIIDFENKLLIQCKNYDSRLSFKDISTFEFYSNFVKQSKLFKKYKKVIVVGGTGQIDNLIREKNDIITRRIEIGKIYNAAYMRHCCIILSNRKLLRSNASCSLI